ncbi:NACHT domain-containing protein [Sulfuricurvum sp.]|uniref:NACHT domain-containing protein n=1 Tax=Sulfuricurvum sp. TaxID=2025608 RepID=UPI00262D161C|nr:NACHT domain-containing protein [Sulfuricurvum sp.]MDD4884016.1 NACHT domain-containing protein [Sulfuricurvum sp.]
MKIIENLLQDIYESIKEKAKSTYEKSIKFENEINIYLEKKYKQNLKLKTFLHRSEPISLDKIYQPVFLEPNIPTTSIKTLFSKTKTITVIGNAGSGKTTLVKYLFNRSIKEKFAIPVIIELRYLNEYDGSIQQYIFEELMKISIEISQKTFIDFLKHGRFVFFLDGYDEVGSKQLHMTAKGLNEFVSEFSNNFYMLTSRPGTYIQHHLLFTTYDIQPMRVEEIFSFIEKQQLEKEFFKKITQSINENLLTLSEYIHNPLLLSLYILTYQKNPTIPNQKSTYYRRVFDILFQEHDSLSKFSFEREKRTNLSQNDFDKVLQAFSFTTYFSNKLFFNRQQAFTLLTNIHYSKQFDHEAFIHDLLVALSLWIEDDGRYYFIHRSMQEYFAAEYIKNTIDHKKIIYEELRHINEKLNHSEYYNFLDMCKELDEYHYTKYYYLPLLQEGKKIIQNIDLSFPKLSIIHVFYSYIAPNRDYRDFRENFIYKKFHHPFSEFRSIVKRYLNELIQQNKIQYFEKTKYQFSGAGYAIDITMFDEDAYNYLLENGLEDLYDTFFEQLNLSIKNCELFLMESEVQENMLITSIFKN